MATRNEDMIGRGRARAWVVHTSDGRQRIALAHDQVVLLNVRFWGDGHLDPVLPHANTERTVAVVSTEQTVAVVNTVRSRNFDAVCVNLDQGSITKQLAILCCGRTP